MAGDLSVLQLLEEKKLKKSDFIVTENYHIRLKPLTAKILIEKISLSFNRSAKYKTAKNYTYQNILLDIVQKLANHVIGKHAEMGFTVPLVNTQRRDAVELQERILPMTPAERKRLRINKSTLWYEKKRLAKGRTIKLHRNMRLKLS